MWFLIGLSACENGFADPSREFGPPIESAAAHPVVVHEPGPLGGLDSARRDVNGAPIGVGCATCHGPTPEASWARRPDAPADIHQGVEIRHGQLPCGSCHDLTDPTRLHLADAKSLDFDEAMTLCGQCHGSQLRDYRAGAHGGMNGYWDLRRGPRSRNHCIDCHAPHAPAYGQVRPAFPPVFNTPSSTSEGH